MGLEETAACRASPNTNAAVLAASSAGGETGVHRHLQNDLQDFVMGTADVQRAADMFPQLGLRVAEDGQGGDREHLPRPHIQPRTGRNVAKREFDEATGQIGMGRWVEWIGNPRFTVIPSVVR